MKRHHIWLLVLVALIVFALIYGKPQIISNDAVLKIENVK